jgi:ERCC4-related helicase
MSYYSTDKDLIQRIGRLRDNGEIGNIFIIRTKETQEEIWFERMMENVNNLNLIYCTDVEDCLTKLKKKNEI